MSDRQYQNYNAEEQRLLGQIAEKNEVDIELIEKLLNYEQTKVHLERRRGAKSDIQHMIEQWIENQGS